MPRNGGVTRQRVLIRSDRLGNLAPASREAIKAYGVATVLDLRSESEVLGSPSPFAAGSDPRYLHRILIDDANMTRIGDAQSMFDRYLHIIDNRPQGFRDVFNAIAEAEDGVLFHCYAGKDRTGLVAAMLLDLAGVPPDQIAADYAETDQQLAQQYEAWIKEAEPARREAIRDELRCPPERILGVLDYLRQKWGGVAGYLEAAGTTPANIDRASSKLA